MDTATSSSTMAIVAINGLHASLIYEYSHKPRHIQPLYWGGAFLDFRVEIEHYWQSLVNITRRKDLLDLDILFQSFPTSAHFYEGAIFTFRNVMAGLKPESLDNIFALCSLSYVASKCSLKLGKPDIENIFDGINIWQDSIGDPQHRHLFNNLILRLWEDMAASPFREEQSLPVFSFDSQDEMEPQSVTMQDISLFSDFSDPFWGGLFDVPGSLSGPNFQTTGTTPGSYPTVLDTPEPPQLSTGGDLRESTVMNILINFLTDCGDLSLMCILGGHGVITKGPHSDVSLEVKNFTQALRRHDCFEDLSARGILAIVDRFVDLTYFENIDEIRDYIITVGKEILPSGQTFAKVCKAVYSFTEMTKIPQVARRQRARRARDGKLKKIPCYHCGEEFTRKTNMRRHITRKHADHSVCDAPMVSVGTG